MTHEKPRFPLAAHVAAAFAACCLAPSSVHASITTEPLSNPSFEQGLTGWGSDFLGTPFGSLNGAPSFSASAGNTFFGNSLEGYQTDSGGISVGGARIGQRVDVSMFQSIDSVTFGGDLFAVAEITSGSGTVEFQQPATGGGFLRYYDADLSVLGSTIFEIDDGAPVDLTGGFQVDDLRVTDSTIPTGTAFIDYVLSPS